MKVLALVIVVGLASVSGRGRSYLGYGSYGDDYDYHGYGHHGHLGHLGHLGHFGHLGDRRGLPGYHIGASFGLHHGFRYGRSLFGYGSPYTFGYGSRFGVGHAYALYNPLYIDFGRSLFGYGSPYTLGYGSRFGLGHAYGLYNPLYRRLYSHGMHYIPQYRSKKGYY